MGYVEKNLMPGEQVLHKAKVHGAIFLSSFFWIGVGGAGIAIGLSNPELVLLSFAGIVLLVLGLFDAFIAFLRQRTTEFALTNKRLIAKYGILRRTTLEPLLHKVETISVEQSFLGRIFNFGSISIGGTGGTETPFPFIAAPMKFRKAVYRQIEELQN